MFRKLKSITQSEYEKRKANAATIEKDSHGEKVLLLPDGTYFKLFRRKRLLSSALWRPYSTRFIQNAHRLSELGILAPRVIDAFRVEELKRDIVHYEPLLGKSVRALHYSNDLDQEQRRTIFQFINQLHDLGVYFRSLHSGNIILGDNGEIGLIDVADMRFQSHPLKRSQRLRNLAHIKRDPILTELIKFAE